jgi:hypothetical protein
MFQSWTIKKMIMVLGGLLVVILIVQMYLFFKGYSYMVHFGLSFVALFIALLLFHSVNIRLKQMRRK